MDDILKVEFPLGPRTVVMSRPSDAQLFALAVIRKPKDGDDPGVKLRFTERVVRFLEALAGPQQWAGVEDDMMESRITPSELLDLFSDVTGFDWAGAAGQQQSAAGPEDQPVHASEPVTEKRTPRVVSGG